MLVTTDESWKVKLQANQKHYYNMKTVCWVATQSHSKWLKSTVFFQKTMDFYYGEDSWSVKYSFYSRILSTLGISAIAYLHTKMLNGNGC